MPSVSIRRFGIPVVAAFMTGIRTAGIMSTMAFGMVPSTIITAPCLPKTHGSNKHYYCQ